MTLCIEHKTGDIVDVAVVAFYRSCGFSHAPVMALRRRGRMENPPAEMKEGLPTLLTHTMTASGVIDVEIEFDYTYLGIALGWVVGQKPGGPVVGGFCKTGKEGFLFLKTPFLWKGKHATPPALPQGWGKLGHFGETITEIWYGELVEVDLDMEQVDLGPCRECLQLERSQQGEGENPLAAKYIEADEEEDLLAMRRVVKPRQAQE